MMIVHRAELHSSLLAALGPETVRHGSEVTAFEQDARSASVFLAPELMAAAVGTTQERDILRNDLYDRPPTRMWGRGRVTLLGDAAHPMLPNVAQGRMPGWRTPSLWVKPWRPSRPRRLSGITKPAGSGGLTASSPSPAKPPGWSSPRIRSWQRCGTSR